MFTNSVYFLYIECIPWWWNVLIQYPVYFAFENDEIDAVLDDVKKNDATGQPATATTGGLVLVLITFCLDMHLIMLGSPSSLYINQALS